MNAHLHLGLFSFAVPGEIFVGFGYVQAYNGDKVTVRKERNISGCVPNAMVLYHHLSYHGAVGHINLLVALALQRVGRSVFSVKLQKLFSKMRFLFPCSPFPPPGSAAFPHAECCPARAKRQLSNSCIYLHRTSSNICSIWDLREEALSLTTEEGGPVPFLLLCICHPLASPLFLFSRFHVCFRNGLHSFGLVTHWQLLVRLWDHLTKRHDQVMHRGVIPKTHFYHHHQMWIHNWPHWKWNIWKLL